MTLLLSVLGGVLALDATSVGQFMISRPLVAGALTGWLLGDPVTGLEVGAMLELFHLAGMPAGGSRAPETGPASVAAVTVVVSLGSGAGLALGIALGCRIIRAHDVRGGRRVADVLEALLAAEKSPMGEMV